ncbi:glycosyltransferase family 2 protein [Phosphitispora fastidiosa]|uniref:glycosyltransferase family 2 protein n=1 Tax=Phosphitispora fastidiosa TaxID=2837202 RepID=UPI001E4DC593|nr:glycosyltransferase involved in cell wall biosynthesis [Phosphitispora fastidiosa]
MKAAVIIPAYNEEQTIGKVIEAVKQVPFIAETIVISDGSTDKTAEIARILGVKVVTLEHNLGKGGAMMVGVNNTDADVVLFLDADLIGLQPMHVVDLLLPVLEGRAEMTVGIFDHGRLATDLAQFIAPYLSGQRAVKSQLFRQISNLELTRYGVEVAMTRFAKTAGISVAEVELRDMTHVMKEEKMGVVRGFVARLKMYWEIARCVTRG